MSTEFERENRYIVLKRNHLKFLPEQLQIRLKPALDEAAERLPKLECVVVESHWPEYEMVWAAIKQRVTGEPEREPQVNAELLAALEEILPLAGWANSPNEELHREHELGNGYAEPILRARAAIAKAKAVQP